MDCHKKSTIDSEMFRWFLVILVLINIVIVPNFASKYVPSEKCGDPLFLTPLLKKGEIDLAKEKSYVNPLIPNIHSHSGFLTVNETNNSNLFFWFFKQSSSEWSSRPVILWLKGGPGCSSIAGIFTENGPFEVKNGKPLKRKYSWTSYYNVLYIDNPIGAGYSFGQYVHNEKEIGQHLFEAMTQFFTLFPQLRKNEFIISGESYAGKYIPALGYEIYKRNPTERFPINLKGLFIGNGYSDPENMVGYAEHLHRLGLIDHRQKLIMQQNEEKVEILIRSGRWSHVTERILKIVDNIHKFTNFSQIYDYVREDFRGDNSFVDYMNNDDFRKNIHVGRLEYEFFSEQVFWQLGNDFGLSVKLQIEELLEVYPIMFYSGQLDIIVAHYLASDFIKQLHWSGAEEYSKAKRNIWYVNNHLAGYYKSSGNLKTALIRDSGHMVIPRQPLFLLDLLNKFIDKAI